MSGFLGGFLVVFACFGTFLFIRAMLKSDALLRIDQITKGLQWRDRRYAEAFAVAVDGGNGDAFASERGDKHWRAGYRDGEWVRGKTEALDRDIAIAAQKLAHRKGPAMTTILKTHPLYGAVETLAADIAFDAGIYEIKGSVREHFIEKAANRIRTLESAGYRVVGPEPTEAMVDEANQAWRDGDFPDAIVARALAAAPTITQSTEDIVRHMREDWPDRQTITETEKGG